MIRYAPVATMSLADLDAILAGDVRAVVPASQAAIPHLPEGGRIVSIGSNLAERVPVPEATVYAMSKSALLASTRGSARKLGPRGITVNLVHPGPTDTDMNPAAGETASDQRARTATGRYGEADDVAAAVAYLAGPTAKQMTGTGLVIDGGANA